MEASGYRIDNIESASTSHKRQYSYIYNRSGGGGVKKGDTKVAESPAELVQPKIKEDISAEEQDKQTERFYQETKGNPFKVEWRDVSGKTFSTHTSDLKGTVEDIGSPDGAFGEVVSIRRVDPSGSSGGVVYYDPDVRSSPTINERMEKERDKIKKEDRFSYTTAGKIPESFKVDVPEDVKFLGLEKQYTEASYKNYLGISDDINVMGTVLPFNKFESEYQKAYKDLPTGKQAEFNIKYLDWSQFKPDELKYVPGGKEYIDTDPSVIEKYINSGSYKPDVQSAASYLAMGNTPYTYKHGVLGTSTVSGFTKEFKRWDAKAQLTKSPSELKQFQYSKYNPLVRSYTSFYHSGVSTSLFPITLSQFAVKHFNDGKTIVFPDVAKQLSKNKLGPSGVIGPAISEVWLGQDMSQEKEFQKKYPVETFFGTLGEITGSYVGSKAVSVSTRPISNLVKTKVFTPSNVSKFTPKFVKNYFFRKPVKSSTYIFETDKGTRFVSIRQDFKAISYGKIKPASESSLFKSSGVGKKGGTIFEMSNTSGMNSFVDGKVFFKHRNWLGRQVWDTKRFIGDISFHEVNMGLPSDVVAMKSFSNYKFFSKTGRNVSFRSEGLNFSKSYGGTVGVPTKYGFESVEFPKFGYGKSFSKGSGLSVFEDTSLTLRIKSVSKGNSLDSFGGGGVGLDVPKTGLSMPGGIGVSFNVPKFPRLLPMQGSLMSTFNPRMGLGTLSFLESGIADSSSYWTGSIPVSVSALGVSSLSSVKPVSSVDVDSMSSSIFGSMNVTGLSSSLHSDYFVGSLSGSSSVSGLRSAQVSKYVTSNVFSPNFVTPRIPLYFDFDTEGVSRRVKSFKMKYLDVGFRFRRQLVPDLEKFVLGW